MGQSAFVPVTDPERRFDPAAVVKELRPRSTGRQLVGAAPLQDIA